MAKASGNTRRKGASSTSSNIDRIAYKPSGGFGGMWEFDGGRGKYGYITITRGPNPYAAYDGVKHIYEVSVTSKDLKKTETKKFYDGFNLAKKWGKEKLKEYNK